VDATAPRLGEAFCFRAHQPSLHRTVLLEVYDPPQTAIPGFRAALLEQVRRVSNLLHPGILRIYAFDEARGMTFIVMEDFAGERLVQVLEERRFARIRGAVHVAENLLDAMVHALGHGTALPWLGPGRVLVSEDHAAKVKLLVTPRPGVRLLPSAAEAPYVAPEVLLVGESAAGPESSLVYSIGALLYHMLAGIPPFEGDTPQAVARRAQSESPPALRRINLKVSPALARTVEKAIDRDPAGRHASLAEFLARIRESA